MRNLSYENEFCMQFLFHANQSHFHKNGFALRLALKQRQKKTRKWSIKMGPVIIIIFLMKKILLYCLIQSTFLPYDTLVVISKGQLYIEEKEIKLTRQKGKSRSGTSSETKIFGAAHAHTRVVQFPRNFVSVLFLQCVSQTF